MSWRHRSPDPASVMGAESIWVVTRGMRMETFRLAAEGKPYPDPEIAHIMHEAAGYMVARYRRQLLLLLAGFALITGGVVVLFRTGNGPAATLVIAAALVGVPFTYRTAGWWRFWARVRRASA